MDAPTVLRTAIMTLWTLAMIGLLRPADAPYARVVRFVGARVALVIALGLVAAGLRTAVTPDVPASAPLAHVSWAKPSVTAPRAWLASR